MVRRRWTPSRVVTNLVAGFQALGTLSGLIGLIVSCHLGVASGPAIVLAASGFYAASPLFAPTRAVRRLFSRLHLADQARKFLTWLKPSRLTPTFAHPSAASVPA